MEIHKGQFILILWKCDCSGEIKEPERQSHNNKHKPEGKSINSKPNSVIRAREIHLTAHSGIGASSPVLIDLTDNGRLYYAHTVYGDIHIKEISGSLLFEAVHAPHSNIRLEADTDIIISDEEYPYGSSGWNSSLHTALSELLQNPLK